MCITRITKTEQVSLVTFEQSPAQIGFLSKLFTVLSEAGVNVDMISQTAPKGSEVTICFTISDEDVVKMLTAYNTLRKEFSTAKPFIVSNNVKISLYGEDMPKYSGIAAGVFDKLAKSNVDVVLITTSEVDISILVSSDNEEKALNVLSN